MIRPSAYQPPLPLNRLIAAPSTALSDNTVHVDVLFVGGGPAGLAGAIELARLADADGLEIAVLEKAQRLGDHCLSGAVVNPNALQELLPELEIRDLPFRQPVQGERMHFLTKRRAFRMPLPPTMRNHGCYIASLCELVRFLAEQAEQRGVHVLTGYPAEALLLENGSICGVRTAASGLDRDGSPGASHNPPTEIRAKVSILCEGARGPLTQAFLASNEIGSSNPPSFALGVKELWRVKPTLRDVVHTVGWPIPWDTFGGGWAYPMADDCISLGIVVGLDSPHASLDPHGLLQQMKQHPLFRRLLEDGELLEWGAKVIPEGGYHALPQRLGGDGCLIAGDAAGLVNVASLKGVHYAIRSGMLAARATHAAFAQCDTTWQALSTYDAAIRQSVISEDLYRTRNMRPAFKHGLFCGGLIAALAALTGGRVPGRRIAMPADADVMRNHTGRNTPSPGLSKLDANFKSGNLTRDDIPLHIIAPTEVPAALGRMYEALCPAGVYEWTDNGLTINAPNCIDCRATDVLGPRWTVREGGSGPRYQQM